MTEERELSIGVVIVAFQPDRGALDALICDVVRELARVVPPVQLFVWDNSPAPGVPVAAGDRVVVMGGDGINLGFGKAINAIIESTRKDWYIVLNQDLRISDGALARAAQAIVRADRETAVLEFAHRPCEHPKEYDPVSRQTPWFSGAAFCVSRAAFMEAGGFDGRLFMYGEDVDLSFRLRQRGMKIIYLPDCVVFHDDLVGPHGQKPLQEVYDRANNILLRFKYGSICSAMQGILWLLGESVYFLFRGRRIAVHRVLAHVFRNASAFAGERVPAMVRVLRPRFDRWRYCRHRLGGRYAIEKPVAHPKVSIVIRTMNRPGMLKEAIETALNQTFGDIQVVVVDDGGGQGAQVVEAFPAMNGREITYVRTSGSVGRAAAGNVGLSHCRGEFICFLDEDDQLYADHVEVLVSHAINNRLRLSYALAEEVSSRYTADGGWVDCDVSMRYRQDFSRVLLWYKNYIPIQSAMFARSLYEELGGFDESLDLYEDWSLWVKYSTRCNFGFVPKTTSRYRLFTDRKRRSATFGDAYANAAATHDYPGVAVSPVEFRRMVEEYVRQRGILCITRERLIATQRRLRALWRRLRGG